LRRYEEKYGEQFKMVEKPRPQKKRAGLWKRLFGSGA
jgi:hypothetical protein